MPCEPQIAYLAHPIDWTDPDRMTHWVRRATYLLNQAGFVVYDPAEAWNLGPNAPDGRISSLINSVNETARIGANLVVALVPVEMSSIGVPVELSRTVDWSRTALVWTQEPRPSATLLAWEYEGTLAIANSEDEFIAALGKVIQFEHRDVEMKHFEPNLDLMNDALVIYGD